MATGVRKEANQPMSHEAQGFILTWIYLGGLFALAFAQNRVISEEMALVASATWVIVFPLAWICYGRLRSGSSEE